MGLIGKRREADRARTAPGLIAVTIRLAADGDRDGVERVAGRDSRPVPAAPLLVAERDGSIEAALSLRSGAVIADPFRHTAELVELLRCHAAGAVEGDRRAVGPAPGRSPATRRPRLAGAAGCP